MNIKELNEIDLNNIGEASGGVKALILVVIVLLILGLSYYFFIGEQRTELERAENREQQLRAEFEEKQQRAANLEAYEEQLEEMERMCQPRGQQECDQQGRQPVAQFQEVHCVIQSR